MIKEKIMLTIQTILGFVAFFGMFSKSIILSFVVLTFTLVYLFGLFESSKVRLNSHLIVGGILYFILSIFILLQMLVNIDFEFSLSNTIVFALGIVGLIQSIVVRRKLKQSL
ncbi:hypothetical protein [Pseudothermotoga thermarum]|uniref:Permease n=1 Tax=Pseudothermotoga thermarum DSM 5069 TaxID=688269 RepID=F7YY30_9THEM|nr:hypothetical protein [Pseudothermotoga thermarum]AEH50840.1 hypothetical protein Theth_0755 [Pseudothermotoga thermarum DSM 5069]